MHFLVTGASGLLGTTFAMQTSAEHTVTGVVNEHPLHGAPFKTLAVDLTRPGAVERLLDKTQPDAVINCAAIARPDDCEKAPELSEHVNAWLPGELARVAAQRKIRLVHISTEAIFDGVKGNYSEEDVTHPLNVYARTKLAGEENVRAADPTALIARVIFYGWSINGKRSLAEWFYNNLSQGRPVNGFTDAIFCPLLVNDLAAILVEMVERKLSGLYHVASAEAISKYDFGMRIAHRFGFAEKLISPTSIKDANLPAQRSTNLSLCTDKLAQALGRSLPGQDEGLDRFLALYQDGYRDRMMNFGRSPII